jgi:hypothetical protein
VAAPLRGLPPATFYDASGVNGNAVVIHKKRARDDSEQPCGSRSPMRTLALAALLLSTSLVAQPADTMQWNRILAAYANPAHGIDYRALKAKDAATLQALRQQLGRVNVAALTPKQQLAHWINVYNVNTVATIVEGYPTESIRDLSTDPIIRLNVFKKERIPVGNALLSLNDVENDKIREGFKDPRIHFAINCAAKSCPPIRTEPYVGARLSEQLDDQARRFLTGPHGVKIEKDGDGVDLHVTKILDWFKDDFEKWGGGRVAFVRKYLPAAEQKQIDAAKGNVDFDFDAYDWDLNDASR